MKEKKVKKKIRRYMCELKKEAETGRYADTWKGWIFGAIDFCRYSGLIGDNEWKELLEEYGREIEGIEDE